MEDKAIALMQLKRALTAIITAAEKLEEAGANTTITGTANTITEVTEDLFEYVKKEFSYRPQFIIDAETEPELLKEAKSEALVDLIKWIYDQEAGAILFRDDMHEELYTNWCEELHIKEDPEYLAALYLLAMDEVVRNHAREVFDFENLCIIPDSINRDWQTGTSSKTTRLIFNLYNYSIHEDTSSEGEPVEGSGYSYTPAVIFASSYASYYVQALKLRYPDYLPD